MQAPQEPAALRVLHLTDPHLFADKGGELRGRVTYDCLSRVLEHHRDSHWDADLALVTGDLVQDDSKEAYEHFCRQLASLGLPLLCVPGNHDVRSLMSEALGRWSFSYCSTVARGPWQLIGIDSCVDGSAAGRVSNDELARLSGLLRDSAAEHILVALHHPPVSVGTPWLDRVGLENGEAFLAVVRASNKVRIVLFGHIHQRFETIRDSIRVLATPSTCRQFRAGSRTFAVDDRPPAYRRLALLPDGNVTTEVIEVS